MQKTTTENKVNWGIFEMIIYNYSRYTSKCKNVLQVTLVPGVLGKIECYDMFLCQYAFTIFSKGPRCKRDQTKHFLVNSIHSGTIENQISIYPGVLY